MATGKTYDDSWMFLDLNEVDLDEYREPHKHEIRKPLHYREDLVEHFIGDPHELGARCPWDSMDQFKFRPGEVTIFSGQNFSGKSAMMTQIMLHWIRGNSSQTEKVLLVSPEFSPTLNLARIVQQCVGKMPAQINEADVCAVLAWLQGNFLIYDVVGSCEIGDLVAAMRYSNAELGVTSVILDNLTIIKLNGADTNQSQAELMTDLVSCARHTNMHITAIAHTRKPQPGEKPDRYNIRGAGQLSDLADNVLILERNHRKEEKMADVNLDSEDRAEIRAQSDSRLHVSKQRHGTSWVGIGKLYFNPMSMRWSELQDANDRPFREITDLASLGGPMRSPTI